MHPKKTVFHNKGNLLRSLGSEALINNPVLHLGMCFSTNCWHRDPHGLPWVEYLHQGSSKIWYGIPHSESDKFRKAAEKLCPSFVQNKGIWMPSDILMIPPDLLLKEGINLTKTIQRPGEYIFVFPKSYSSSICTGFTMSESAYFAVQSWVGSLPQIIQ
ncbi:jg27014, partial [Pararge aegeria aegeria]